MKKIAFLTLLLVATALFALALSAAAGPRTAAALAPMTAANPSPALAAAPPEKHPHIDEALEHMRAAKHELEIAEHDFKGHRVKSLEHLQQAIGEAEMCLKVD